MIARIKSKLFNQKCRARLHSHWRCYSSTSGTDKSESNQRIQDKGKLRIPKDFAVLDFKIKVGQTIRYWFNREDKAVVGLGRKQSKRR